jgi:hypothetical protein
VMMCVNAMQRAKNTEMSKKKVSEKQKLFFQNPENRRMRGLQMKGKFKIPLQSAYNVAINDQLHW